MPNWVMTDVESLIALAPADMEVAAAMYHALDAEYPGHQWLTSASHETGMAHVKLLYLDKLGKNGVWGFNLHLNTLKSDPTLKSVVRAGGELLERYGLRRDRPANDETRLRSLEHGLELTR